jgi:HD superfamily phosphohydrolase
VDTALSIVKLKELATTLYPSTKGRLEEEINSAFDSIGFTEQYVEEAIQKSRRGVGRTGKVVKDNIWGMVELDWATIKLLDCPVFQRLRGIKQLGFSYLTYPTAEHSRFAHSLGMTCVVSRFLQVMDRKDPQDLFDENERVSAVHAAVLHDIGHMPFSHALETAYHDGEDRYRVGGKTLRKFILNFKEELEAQYKLGECLSIAMVLSPRFRRFYDDCVSGDPGNDPNRIFRIASLVAGLPHAAEFPGLANIISGSSVDADKIDYISRDSAACGIAIGLDVARLFLRSEFVKVSSDEAQRLYMGRAPSANPKIFIVNSSGADTIEEIAVAKASLYQRIYLHHTTRSAERILSKAIRLTKAGKSHPDLSRPLEAWAMDDISLLRELSEAPKTKSLGWRLRNRDLPKRACVFGRDAAEVHLRPSHVIKNAASHADRQFIAQVTGAPLETFRRNVLYGQELEGLELKLRKEVISLRRLLKKADCEGLPDEKEPDLLTVLPMPNLMLSQPDAIIKENGHLLLTPKKSTVDELSDASEMFKSSGYVMTTPAWRALTLIAARKVFSEAAESIIQQVSIPRTNEAPLQVDVMPSLVLNLDTVCRRAALETEDLEVILSKAAECGYFDERPLLAKPFGVDQAKEIAGKVNEFDGEGSWRVTPESVAAFLSQFPPNLREEAARLLGGIKMIDRVAIRTAVADLVKKVPQTAGQKWLTQLSPNSGNIVRMLAESDLFKPFEQANWTAKPSLQDVLGEATVGDTILVIDDCAVSGIQASAQLLAWFGKPRSEWPKECRGERNISTTALDEKLRGVLSGSSVTFGFVTANETPKDKIVTIARELGLSQIDVTRSQDLTHVQADMSQELRKFLTRVGADVLTYCRSRQQDTDPADVRAGAEDDALGYSGKRCLLTTMFNVPTSTITALWCPGTSGGRPWVPLLIRRGYLSNLILH